MCHKIICIEVCLLTYTDFSKTKSTLLLKVPKLSIFFWRLGEIEKIITLALLYSLTADTNTRLDTIILQSLIAQASRYLDVNPRKIGSEINVFKTPQTVACVQLTSFTRKLHRWEYYLIFIYMYNIAHSLWDFTNHQPKSQRDQRAQSTIRRRRLQDSYRICMPYSQVHCICSTYTRTRNIRIVTTALLFFPDTISFTPCVQHIRDFRVPIGPVHAHCMLTFPRNTILWVMDNPCIYLF